MPQFDFYTFAVQTFWSLTLYFLIYYILVYYYLTKIAEVLKIRRKLILLYKNKKMKPVNLYDKIVKTFIR